MTELRVLQVVRNLDIGGAQEVVRTLARNLQHEGHFVAVCTLRDGPLRSDLEALGIPVDVVQPRSGSVLAPLSWVREMWRIRSDIGTVVTRHRINVVQTHLLRSVDFVVASLRKRKSLPLVFWTFHNVNFTLRREHLGRHTWLLRPKRHAYRLLYRGGSRMVDGLIAVSDETRTAMLEEFGAIGGKIRVIPNGVDVDLYERKDIRDAARAGLGVDRSAPLLIMVGTFKTQKGHVYLIDALSKVIEDHPDVHALLVGDGELRPEIERRIEDEGLHANVEILGSRRDVPDLLAASDVFVLPSLWEGLPMALLEAMASGLPCIATRVSGSSQVIQDGVNGLLVQPGNVEELEVALIRLLTDGDLADSLGVAARRRVIDVFSSRQQARSHIALFQSRLLTGKRQMTHRP